MRGAPGTPKRNRSTAKSVPTPLSRGTAIRQKEEFDGDCNGKYSSDDYKRFILHDLEHNRVFVDMEDFMEHVLHVPGDWKTRWGPTITKVKENKEFISKHDNYVAQCNNVRSKEEFFYEPLVGMVNKILCIASTVESTKPITPHQYITNDPNRLLCGVLEKGNLSPDIIAIHEEFPLEKLVEEWVEKGKGDVEKEGGEGGRLAVVEEQDENEDPGGEGGRGDGVKPYDGRNDGGNPAEERKQENGQDQGMKSENDKKPQAKQNGLTWAQPLQVLEVKPFDNSLIDGSWAPRLMRNGTPTKISADVP